jgi:hypothetical protein
MQPLDGLTKIGIAVVVLITVGLMSWLAGLGWPFLLVIQLLACWALELCFAHWVASEHPDASKELFPRFVLENTFLGNVEPEN